MYEISALHTTCQQNRRAAGCVRRCYIVGYRWMQQAAAPVHEHTRSNAVAWTTRGNIVPAAVGWACVAALCGCADDGGARPIIEPTIAMHADGWLSEPACDLLGRVDIGLWSDQPPASDSALASVDEPAR